jgi:hypothetical protein
VREGFGHFNAPIGNGLLNASPMEVKNGGASHIRFQSQEMLMQQMLTKTPTKNGQIVMQTPKYEVYMRCVTWSRDSHGLFDYESKNIAKKNIKTQTGGKILRVNDDVEFVSIRTKPEEVDEAAKPMIIVRQTNGQF